MASRETGYGQAPRRRRCWASHWDHPKRDSLVVTVGAAEDDAEVYGAAWPLIEEWRRLWKEHPAKGGTLSWLVRDERILELELAMLEAHGLTLPPDRGAR